MSARKIDYRVATSPIKRPTKCRNAIRIALRKGKKTFGNLLGETDLSRSTLAFHLKEMHKKGEVEREPDPKDYRVTCYSLSNDGMNELRRQEDIEILGSAESSLGFEEFMSLSSEAAEKLVNALTSFLEPSIQKFFFRSAEEDPKFPKKVLTYRIYSSGAFLKNTKVKNYVREFAEQAKISMLTTYAKDPRYLENINNLTLVFRFDKDKLRQVKEYMKEVDAEIASHAPLLKIPDKRDYFKNKKKES